MNRKPKKNLGWGKLDKHDTEIWDTSPVFLNNKITSKDWLKLIFCPKKWLMYRYLKKSFEIEMKDRSLQEPFRVLDVGCGTGATVVDMKKMFGRKSDVVGLDTVKLQVEIAGEKIKKHGVNAEIEWYDGEQFPFSNNSFDAVYSSEVLAHVRDVPFWLSEINRVLKPGGTFVISCKSELGRHAYVRKYFFNNGLNVDRYAEHHISLYSKSNLKNLMDEAGFTTEKMLGASLVDFLIHPEDFYPKLQAERKFFFLKIINRLLYFCKKITSPFSTSACKLYDFLEMILIGKWIEGHSYVILGKKTKDLS